MCRETARGTHWASFTVTPSMVQARQPSRRGRGSQQSDRSRGTAASQDQTPRPFVCFRRTPESRVSTAKDARRPLSVGTPNGVVGMVEGRTHGGTNRPPSQCCSPAKNRTPRLGAVRLRSVRGCNVGVLARGPCSTSQPEGMSTERMGTVVWASEARTASNGARTGGWKEKPKRQSRTTSLAARAASNSPARKGISRLSHCVLRDP